MAILSLPTQTGPWALLGPTLTSEGHPAGDSGWEVLILCRASLVESSPFQSSVQLSCNLIYDGRGERRSLQTTRASVDNKRTVAWVSEVWMSVRETDFQVSPAGYLLWWSPAKKRQALASTDFSPSQTRSSTDDPSLSILLFTGASWVHASVAAAHKNALPVLFPLHTEHPPERKTEDPLQRSLSICSTGPAVPARTF